MEKKEKHAEKLTESVAGKLIRQVEDELARKRKEVAEFEKGQREKLVEETKREEGLQAKLKDEKAIAEKMIAEYSELEKKAEEKAVQEVEMKSLKEQDVKEGRVSLRKFLKEGKTKKERIELSVAQVQKELGEILQLIRKKRVDILNTEKELCECQMGIRHMAAYPLRNLKEAFTSLRDFIDFQMTPVLEELTAASSKLEQIKHQFHLITEEKGLSRGFIWPGLTLEKAQGIQFDPVLPERHIETLRVKLKEHEGQKDTLLNIEWYWQGDEFHVGPSLAPGKSVKTGDEDARK